ncbi:hypothetical protein BU14_2162s0001 [Porphyra umbilicalis]|uniref:Uncharacterized protein n=1 Tax=Porphyra umbilicalis TaxID=2786 RepID=A0A1X6NJR4_PORUM|nr:hypothetical protein BU14_2162s0001 [Porphyra umbilicalis]|eukprot:OSX68859.1 hypothetical protein BU14_2162s0001 [Porphyra umbilicalis]
MGDYKSGSSGIPALHPTPCAVGRISWRPRGDGRFGRCAARPVARHTPTRGAARADALDPGAAAAPWRRFNDRDRPPAAADRASGAAPGAPARRRRSPPSGDGATRLVIVTHRPSATPPPLLPPFLYLPTSHLLPSSFSHLCRSPPRPPLTSWASARCSTGRKRRATAPPGRRSPSSLTRSGCALSPPPSTRLLSQTRRCRLTRTMRTRRRPTRRCPWTTWLTRPCRPPAPCGVVDAQAARVVGATQARGGARWWRVAGLPRVPRVCRRKTSGTVTRVNSSLQNKLPIFSLHRLMAASACRPNTNKDGRRPRRALP